MKKEKKEKKEKDWVLKIGLLIQATWDTQDKYVWEKKSLVDRQTDRQTERRSGSFARIQMFGFVWFGLFLIAYQPLWAI